MKKYGLLFVTTAIVLVASGQGYFHEENHLFTSGDTVRINQYLDLAQQLEDAKPDSAVYYYQQARRLATGLKDVKKTGRAYLDLFLLYFKGNKYAEAFDLAQEEVNLGKQWNDNELQMKGYNNLAIAYQYLSDYQTAADFYLKAATVANKMHQPAMEAKILDNMSSLFLKLKNYRLAYNYGLQSYNLSWKTKDSVYIISGLISMGGALGGIGQYDSALSYLNEAEAMAGQINEKLKLMLAKENKGFLYTKAHRTDAAIVEFKEALTLARRDHYPYVVATALNGLANNEMLKNNYNKAEQYAAEAIAIARQQALGNELAEMYNNMSSIKEHLGKPGEALAYKNLYEQVNDSIMNVQIQTNITRMNIQYNTAKKDKEILQQKLELTEKQAAIQKRNNWLLLFIIAVVALATILMLSFRSYHNKKKLHAQTIHTLQKEQEVVRLKALMEGKDEERQRISKEMHDDIGSGLTTILFLSNQLKSKSSAHIDLIGGKIAGNANMLIAKMNEIIWSMNTDYDSLEDLVIYLRHNVGELLGNAGIDYHFHIPPVIPDNVLSGAQRRNIYLVVKEAVHNIIKHAQATEVNLTFLFDRHIQVTICDNGKGFQEQQVFRFNNGLKNMKQRMEAIGGTLTIQHSQGVMITLTAPLAG